MISHGGTVVFKRAGQKKGAIVLSGNPQSRHQIQQSCKSSALNRRRAISRTRYAVEPLESRLLLSDSGGVIFVMSETGGISKMIGEYTTAVATVNASLISGLSYYSQGIAVSGSDLFVTNPYTGVIGEYTTSGRDG